jgi:acetyl esterase/lipase
MNVDLVELLDPELRKPIKKMLAQTPPMNLNDLPAARAASKKMFEAVIARMPTIPGVVCEDRKIAGPANSPAVPIRIYRPENCAGLLPALLWIHGGGYMFGDLDQEDLIARPFCVAARCVVVSVDYRLTPENPFPAPLEDCYSALKWLATQAEGMKIDRSCIAIGGASAGGGLAAALAVLARDRAEVKTVFQLLVYPMINDCTVAPAGPAVRDALFWTRENNLIGWRSYLGCQPGGKDVSCYAAAFRTAELAGLPPAYIAVGDIDLFAEEDIEYARRLVAAGVPTELHVYPGACHAFDMLVPGADVSRRFSADIQRALKRALRG